MTYVTTYETSRDTSASAEAVDALYRDAASWTAWDPGTDGVAWDGPFATGTTGTFTPKGGEPLAYTIVEATPGRGHVDEFPMGDGVVLRVHHRVEPRSGGGARITHRAELIGGAAMLAMAPELMPEVCDEMPDTVARIAALAEERAAGAPVACAATGWSATRATARASCYGG